MASKQPIKLFDVQGIIKRILLRSREAFYHTLLWRKRQLLLIGESSQLSKHIIDGLGSRWAVTHILPDKRHSSSASNTIILDNDPKAVQKQLQGLEFASIVVLPSTNKQWLPEQQGFTTDYLEQQQSTLMMNVLGYRIAHKLLSPLGMVLLSADRAQFLKHSEEHKAKKKNQSQESTQTTSTKETEASSQGVVNGQIAQLGFLIGERDYTPLTSHSLTSLSLPLTASDSSLLAKYYLKWIKRQSLPFPGSFALFHTQHPKTKHTYVEYL